MAQVHWSTIVEAPIEQVFEYASDDGWAPDWMGPAATVRARCVERDGGRRCLYVFPRRWFRTPTVSIELKSAGEGGTFVRLESNHDVDARGWLARLKAAVESDARLAREAQAERAAPAPEFALPA
jgi:hypothetical protein